MCYKRIMRDWVREKLMRRRKKPVTNNSESPERLATRFPQDQPTPLQPSYPQSLERGGCSESFLLEQNAPSQLLLPTRLKPSPSCGPSEKRSAETGETGMEIVPKGKRPLVDQPTPKAARIVIPEAKLVMETQPESLSRSHRRQRRSAKHPKGYVVLAIGLPGSGKTTWFKRRGVTPLSSDMLRSILFDDITEQRYQGLVFSTLRSLLRARLIAKMPWNYVDATNLSPHERRQWIKMARSFGYEVHAVFFDVPFEVCMERNSAAITW